MGRFFGYARVSREEQNLELQISALKSAGCVEKFIFTDKVSGVKAERPGLNKCLEMLGAGDTLIVWRLDRLERSISHLIKLIESLMKEGISFKSICDGVIDTTTASGELIFNIFSSLAQFERSLTQERTRAGLSAARARGRLGGRKPIRPEDPRVKTAQKMHEDKSIKIEEICKTLQVSRPTLYRYLNIAKKSAQPSPARSL